ncbi:MAG: response regulator [Rhodospirillales bacterium]|nr:response regulator [Rhodospirillales bacterium]
MARVKAGPKKNARNVRALVIDDNEKLAAAVEKFLRTEMFFSDVIISGNGRAAWDLIMEDEAPFELIICGWTMPGMEGTEILEAIRDLGRDVPFILTGGVNNMRSAVDAKSLGASAYLPKPFKPQQLRDKVVALLGSGTYSST